MRINVLLFAALADVAGLRETTVELPDDATADDLLAELGRRHPSLTGWRDRVACAIDEKYVPSKTRLQDGATVAIIPPVSGG